MALVIIARDRWAIGQILLTVIVMYFFIQGRKWAKWLLLCICSLLVVILIGMVLALSSKLSTTLVFRSLIMAALITVIAIYMVTSKDLNRCQPDPKDDKKALPKPTSRYLELLTLFPDKAASTNRFLQFLTSEQDDFKQLW
ncbi:hypothetical protein [Neosynechococcus sphagnicola]|uniref:hypothetical protein n=1 Tax=Neosynechococcus sphagnicola TaxID=1501145 RepID=UPI0006923068|nr:hypothetical protein [Neosynechococcus sphagnicola]